MAFKHVVSGLTASAALLFLFASCDDGFGSSPLTGWQKMLDDVEYAGSADLDDACTEQFGSVTRHYYGIVDSAGKHSCIEGCEVVGQTYSTCENTTTAKLGNVELYSRFICVQFGDIKVYDFDDMRKCNHMCLSTGECD